MHNNLIQLNVGTQMFRYSLLNNKYIFIMHNGQVRN